MQAFKADGHAGCIAAQASAAEHSLVHAVCFVALSDPQVTTRQSSMSRCSRGLAAPSVSQTDVRLKGGAARGTFTAQLPGAKFQSSQIRHTVVCSLRRLPQCLRPCGSVAST